MNDSMTTLLFVAVCSAAIGFYVGVFASSFWDDAIARDANSDIE